MPPKLNKESYRTEDDTITTNYERQNELKLVNIYIHFLIYL